MDQGDDPKGLAWKSRSDGVVEEGRDRKMGFNQKKE